MCSFCLEKKEEHVRLQECIPRSENISCNSMVDTYIFPPVQASVAV